MTRAVAGAPARPSAEDVFDDLADLPEHLRAPAAAMVVHHLAASEEWALTRAEVLAAVTSASFRPVLEEEARLGRLGLAASGWGGCQGGKHDIFEKDSSNSDVIF